MKKLILLCLISLSSLGQIKKPQNEIGVLFNIYLNDKKIESDSITIIVNENKPILITDAFITFFKKNRVYDITITSNNYNKHCFKLNTAILTAYNNKIDIYLRSNQKDVYTENLQYNNLLKKYIIYE